MIAFCGEPSANGDRLAAVPKRVGLLAAPWWRRLIGASAAGPAGAESPEHEASHNLETEVDVHAFEPAALAGLFERAGFEAVEVHGEELVANLYGWGLRTLEASAEPAEIPWRWRQFAFKSYMALRRLDTVVLEPNLPPRLFYNLVLSARVPG